MKVDDTEESCKLGIEKFLSQTGKIQIPELILKTIIIPVSRNFLDMSFVFKEVIRCLDVYKQPANLT